MLKNKIIDFIVDIISPKFSGFTENHLEIIKSLSIDEWAFFLEFAKRNFVSPLLFFQLKAQKCLEVLPVYVGTKLSENNKNFLLRNLKISAVFLEVSKILNKLKIEFVVLKGLDLQHRIYQSAFLRPMLDIDILIKEKDLPLITRHMLSLGAKKLQVSESEFVDSFKHHEAPLIYKNVAIEFHKELVDVYDNSGLIKINPWNYTSSYRIEGQEVKVFQPEFQIIYLCHHIYNTLRGGRIKLFWYYDIVKFLEKFSNELNRSKLDELFNAIGNNKIVLNVIAQTNSIFVPVYVPIFQGSEIDYNVDKYFLYAAMIDKGIDLNKPHYLDNFLKIKGHKNKLVYILHKFFPSKAFIKRKYHVEKDKGTIFFYFKNFKLLFSQIFRSLKTFFFKKNEKI